MYTTNIYMSIFYSFYDKTRDIKSNIDLRLSKFPRAFFFGWIKNTFLNGLLLNISYSFIWSLYSSSEVKCLRRTQGNFTLIMKKSARKKLEDRLQAPGSKYVVFFLFQLLPKKSLKLNKFDTHSWNVSVNPQSI